MYLKTNVGYKEEMTMMVDEKHILSDLYRINIRDGRVEKYIVDK